MDTYYHITNGMYKLNVAIEWNLEGYSNEKYVQKIYTGRSTSYESSPFRKMGS